MGVWVGLGVWACVVSPVLVTLLKSPNRLKTMREIPTATNKISRSASTLLNLSISRSISYLRGYCGASLAIQRAMVWLFLLPFIESATAKIVDPVVMTSSTIMTVLFEKKLGLLQ